MGTMLDKAAARRLRIMVVEDEQDICSLLRYNLEACGYLVAEASDGEEAELQIKEQPPDLMLLDWMLPEMSGIELLRRVRRRPETQSLPVIVVTARSEEADRVRAFETGADDLVVKPFSVSELVARVEALLRRATPTKVARVIKAGDTELDRDLMCVRRRGKTLQLGPTDFRLLEFFLEAPGRVHSREAILEAVWSADADIDERTIDVHIGRLRKSLLSGWRSDPIKTVRGVGYRFDPK
jgi:two-component system phosphate regulon response regulator PhoB